MHVTANEDSMLQPFLPHTMSWYIPIQSHNWFFKRSEKLKHVALPCELNWVSWRTEIISSRGGRSGNFSSSIDSTFSWCFIIVSVSEDMHLKRMLPETSKDKINAPYKQRRNKNVCIMYCHPRTFFCRSRCFHWQIHWIRHWMLFTQEHPLDMKAIYNIWTGWLVRAHTTANRLVPALPRCAACFCTSIRVLQHDCWQAARHLSMFLSLGIIKCWYA